MTMRLTGTFVLVLGGFVFAGPALADNGHGNGNGNGDGAGGSPGDTPHSGPTPTPTPTPHPNPTPDPGPDPGPTPTTVVPRPKDHLLRLHPVDPGGPVSGEAVAVTASRTHRAGASASVLAATRQAELPFTGLQLWLVAVLGLALLGAGIGLRQIRTVGAVVQSGHD